MRTLGAVILLEGPGRCSSLTCGVCRGASHQQQAVFIATIVIVLVKEVGVTATARQLQQVVALAWRELPVGARSLLVTCARDR